MTSRIEGEAALLRRRIGKWVSGGYNFIVFGQFMRMTEPAI